VEKDKLAYERKDKKVLITGSTGFIGSHVKSALELSGYEVLGLGRGNKEDFNLDLSSKDLKNIIKEISPSLIFHFASGSNISRANEEKEKEYIDTVTSTENLLNSLKDLSSKPKIIYLSSQAVYGIPKSLPVTEDHETSPKSIYGENKLKAEKLIIESGFNYLIFRVSSIYGPNQDYKKSGVITKFIHRMKNNEAPIVFNNLETFSDFLYVKDLASALVKATSPQYDISGSYNLASGKPTTMKDLLDALYEYFPNAPKAVLESNDVYLSNGIYLSADKLKLDTNWSCKYNLKGGLSDMLPAEGEARQGRQTVKL
jgi:UDP-glucose 4-epimerase